MHAVPASNPPCTWHLYAPHTQQPATGEQLQSKRGSEAGEEAGGRGVGGPASACHRISADAAMCLICYRKLSHARKCRVRNLWANLQRLSTTPHKPLTLLPPSGSWEPCGLLWLLAGNGWGCRQINQMTLLCKARGPVNGFSRFPQAFKVQLTHIEAIYIIWWIYPHT